MATNSEPEVRTGGTRQGGPSTIALRTYMSLRLAALGVIAVLFVSVFVEFREADNCLLGSISEYYFTSVQSVLVGALVAMGLVMVVLWGKTALEDALLDLAGLLAPIVAFAPTPRPSSCGVTNPVRPPAGTVVPPDEGVRNVVNASESAVTNNVQSYLLVIGTGLVLVLAVRIVAQISGRATVVTETRIAFWVTWTITAALVLVLGLVLRRRPEWVYDGLHTFAAAGMFGLVMLAIVTIGFQKLRGIDQLDEPPHLGWAVTYFALAGTMALLLATLSLVRLTQAEGWYHDHWVFVIETVSLGCLAGFWVLQTWDRWQVHPPLAEEDLGQRVVGRHGSPPEPWS